MEILNPCKVDGLEAQDAGEEVLVHDPAAQKIHILNKSAWRLLQLCDGSGVDSLVEAMMPNEAFDRSRVHSDVERVLAQFCDLGLIKAVASAERTPQ